jgi:CheY-like chemotaxis protein
MLIMLCDDDIDDIELFQEALSETLPNTELMVSNTCEELISSLKSIKPSIIFLDINMPEMSGWDCLKHLKDDPELKSIFVVMYTTSSSKRDIDMAKDSGAYRLITKPDRFQELRKVLSSIIQEITPPHAN